MPTRLPLATMQAEQHPAARPTTTSTAHEDTMESDPLSGRTLLRDDPWQQILWKRHDLKPLKPALAQSSTSKQPLNLRTAPPPRLPESDSKVIFHPRSGLRIANWHDRQITQSIQRARRIPEHVFFTQVTTQPQASQNLIVASTPDDARVEDLRNITTLQLGATTYEVATYLKNISGTVRGVIHGIDEGTTQDQLHIIIATAGPRIIRARMLGASSSVVITFKGPHVPVYVKA